MGVNCKSYITKVGSGSVLMKIYEELEVVIVTGELKKYSYLSPFYSTFFVLL